MSSQQTQAAPARWTTETPTADGFYWVQDAGDDEPRIVHVDEGWVYALGFEFGCQLSQMSAGTRWSGPLTPPAEQTAPADLTGEPHG